jgi:hypothetical protein
MKATSLSIAALIALGAATSALAADSYGDEQAPRGRIVAGERPAMMTAWDYFFNNPEKYRTMRNGSNDYYQGVERR